MLRSIVGFTPMPSEHEDSKQEAFRLMLFVSGCPQTLKQDTKQYSNYAVWYNIV